MIDTFDAERPNRVGVLGSGRMDPDQYVLTEKEIYLHCPDGYGRSKLNNQFWERTLGVPATTRNWRSVTVLTDMLIK
jgi:uncharacterized protein (DUF1697 family)